MMAQLIHRKTMKAQTRELLRTAEVNPRKFTLLFLLLGVLLGQLDLLTANAPDPLSIFVSILTSLLSITLGAGFLIYCLEIRRGQRSEYLTLFDGFSFVGKIIVLTLLQALFIYLWSLLFLFPGIVAAYRYRFALMNLCENPNLTPFEALNLSKRQTFGYKQQLFLLDLSYLGWGLLASAGTLLLMLHLSQGILLDPSLMADPVSQFAALSEAMNALPSSTFLLSSLWTLLVEVFYLPNYRCMELGYYEVAKNTSGFHPTLPTGPDSLGG